MSNLFIVAAPSGCGKTSLVESLINNTKNLRVSISHTTRKPRAGEVNGTNYHFVSVAEFQKMVSDDAFIEHAEVFENFYGTSKKLINHNLNNNIDVILEIDWQGASQVHALLPESVGIFILPPSLQALRERLTNRGQDDAQVIETRMSEAVNEISHFEQADFIVINENFGTALEDLKAVIRSARLSIKHQVKSNSDLLNKLIS